jgi:hypothetical protein
MRAAGNDEIELGVIRRCEYGAEASAVVAAGTALSVRPRKQTFSAVADYPNHSEVGYTTCVSAEEREAQQYAWNWFALHSGQRMQLVNFWLVAVAFLGAAYVQASSSNLRPIAVGVAVAGAVASIAFALLDARTRRLVQVAEEALQRLEARETAAGTLSEARLVERAHTARRARLFSYRIVIEGLQIIVAVLFISAGVYASVR